MKSFVVIGVGNFGRSVATTLYDLGHDVLVLDMNADIIQDISESVTHAVVGDATDENVLSSVGVSDFSVGIVAIGSNIQASVLVTLLLKELGVDFVVARADSNLHSKVLEKLGCDKVIFPEYDTGIRLANNLGLSNIVDYLELSSSCGIIEIPAPKSWQGDTLGKLNVRKKHGVNIVAIKSDDGVNVYPTAEDVVSSGDIIVMIGNNDNLDNVAKVR